MPPSCPPADPDGDGLRNLIEYTINSAPKLPIAPGIASAFAGNELTLSFNRNSNATDVTIVIEASTNLNSGSWTPVAQKAGAVPWSVASGIQVSDGNSGPVTVTDAFSTAQGTQRYLRMKVSKP